jgi:selenium-binding protein 1
VLSLADLSSSIWTWHRDGNKWAVTKVIDIPAEPADPDRLPPMLKGFKTVPPFVTDIDLSMDDRFLYVACWGTGDMRQYDVSDPFKPKLTGKIRIGGVVSRAVHPGSRNGPLNGGPQMVEISRDGKRVYVTTCFTVSSTAVVSGWHQRLMKLDADPKGGITDNAFFVDWPKSATAPGET